MLQEDFYTVVNPLNDEETRVHLTYDDVGADAEEVGVKIDGPLVIGRQQLAELGTMFLALATRGENGVGEVDFSSCDSLLEGFNLKGKRAAQALAEELYD